MTFFRIRAEGGELIYGLLNRRSISPKTRIERLELVLELDVEVENPLLRLNSPKEYVPLRVF
jgi:hypothetical protein